MKMMNGAFEELLEKTLSRQAARDLSWHDDDDRGRWLVLERGPGHLLRGVPKHIRDRIDAQTPRYARRFSSLSRARAFAREMGGEVRRCRRHMWKPMTNPWGSALRRLGWR